MVEWAGAVGLVYAGTAALVFINSVDEDQVVEVVREPKPGEVRLWYILRQLLRTVLWPIALLTLHGGDFVGWLFETYPMEEGGADA